MKGHMGRGSSTGCVNLPSLRVLKRTEQGDHVRQVKEYNVRRLHGRGKKLLSAIKTFLWSFVERGGGEIDVALMRG
jgi:hypothetical protein